VAVNPEEVQFIVNAITTLTNQQQSAAQQRSLETGQATIIQAINGVLALLRQVGSTVEEIRSRLAAAQLQTAINTVQSDRNYRAILSVPSSTVSGVWAQTDPVTGNTFGADVGLAATLAYLHNTFGIIRAEFAPRFAFTMFQGSIALNPGPARTPNWDSTKILSTDDLVTYLNRVAGVGTWLYESAPGDPDYAVNYGTNADPFNWLCLVSRQEFAQLQQQLGLLPSGTAPVWPGLSHVTLGTQVAITPPTQSIPGPMDGVLVDITGGTANLPHYKVGTMDSWKALGTLMFLNDDGAAETFQLLAAATAVYVPRAMAHAASAQFKWLPGLTGTVTPWTVT
jgi:hypothetical protein